MKKKEVISLIALIIIVFLAGYSYFTNTIDYEESAILMDTIVNVQVSAKEKEARFIVKKLFKYIEECDSVFSYYKINSDVWKINNSEIDSIKISNDIYRMLKIGEKLYIDTDSLYDLTVGDLTDIWDFEKEKIPTKKKIAAALKNVGFYKVKFCENYVKKPKKTKLNFGSIAKGLIIDKSVKFLKKHKIKKGLVNAGGDIKLFGYKKPITIGIQHPRKKDGKIIGTISVQNKAVVTSGDYERYFTKSGIRYHHILNPKTGYPANSCISVTVISDDATTADAYSTALFLVTPEKAIKMANNTKNVEAIVFYMKNDKIFYKKSFGIDKYLFKIIDNNVKEGK